MYKTLIFQHRTTVQDALQILTEFVQLTYQRTSEADEAPELRIHRPSDPSQKRYALFKDGSRLEEDKLLAELVDPQVLWTRVVCTFMEIGAAPKKTLPQVRSVPTRSSSEDMSPETPDSDDCHLLILYRKQQAFRNFHFNPAISVGRAIKIITDAFNIPATTINQDDWSYRMQRNSSSGSMQRITVDEAIEGGASASTTPTGMTSNHSSPGDISLASNSSGGISITPNSSGNTDSGTSPSNVIVTTSPTPPSPKPLFPFSLFSSNKNSQTLELAPVASPVLSLTSSSSAPSFHDASLSAAMASSSAPLLSPPLNMLKAAPRLLSVSTMGGDLDNRHECITKWFLW